MLAYVLTFPKSAEMKRSGLSVARSRFESRVPGSQHLGVSGVSGAGATQPGGDAP